MEGGERGDRRIQLFCPSISATIELVAGDEQKVDLGSIARAFGLDPNTVKLNGYFISRGADLIASSVTWKSLIGFFSARGLPTPIIVHGKLSKIGSKRLQDSTGEMCDRRDSKRPHHEACRIPDSHEYNGLCSKRKWWLEDESSPKRTRSNEAASKINRFPCSIISNNMKRMRLEEIVAPPPMKKLR